MHKKREILFFQGNSNFWKQQMYWWLNKSSFQGQDSIQRPLMKTRGDWAESDLRSRRVGEADLAATWSHFSSSETAKEGCNNGFKTSDHERSRFTNFEIDFIKKHVV